MNPKPDAAANSTLLPVLQSTYLDALRRGSGRAADEVVDSALVASVTANEIYLDLFQPTAYEIGRLWQRNEFSVAEEHLATAIMERQMGELHPLFRPQKEKSKTLVIGCVNQELHSVGARMVADFFEQDGWTVHYLGASMPMEDFIAIARERNADLIGLAAQMAFHVPTISEFVRALDGQGLGGIPVMVGGYPFVQQPDLYKSLGVRFAGADARQAVLRAKELMGE